jgi:Holliday junction resolvasome RuvABC DNA-binding subunit
MDYDHLREYLRNLGYSEEEIKAIVHRLREVNGEENMEVSDER